jgi:hypothetical protein
MMVTPIYHAKPSAISRQPSAKPSSREARRKKLMAEG